MIKRIGKKWMVLPDVITNEDGSHSIDTNNVLREYTQLKAQKKDCITWYNPMGKKDKEKHKEVCKYLYDLYNQKVCADYTATLIYPEKSKAFYAICIHAVNDKVIEQIFSDSLEITLDSKGRYTLRLRVNNTNMQQLLKKGCILKEYTKTEFEKILQEQKEKTLARGLQVNSIGDCFEYLYAEKIGNKDHIKDSIRFDLAPDCIDNINGGLRVQCKAQKATICLLDTLAKIYE